MAKALGEKTLGVDDGKIPSTAAVRRVEERVEELSPIFEEREEAMFAIKEEVVHLLAGVSILMSYGVNPHYVKLPIFSEIMENSIFISAFCWIGDHILQKHCL